MLEGTCHCKAVRWELDVFPDGATACNCTVCRRYGALWAYGHQDVDIRATGATRAYVRGKAVEFHFCPACGSVAFWRGRALLPDGRRRMAVNLRLAEPEAVAKVPIDHFDGFDKFEDLPRDGRCVGDMWF